MTWFIVIAAFYFSSGALVALRFGWHMVFRLDEYDWRYGEVWANFWFSVILWPLLLIKPRHLIHPDLTSSGPCIDPAAAARERARLWRTPPPCGASLLYYAGRGSFDSVPNEFVFCASEVESVLAQRVEEVSQRANGDEGAMLNFVRRRDDTQLAPVEFPSVWDGVEEIAMALIQSERTQVTCCKCGKRIAAADISESVSHVVGWTFHVWSCPSDHSLLTVNTATVRF